MQNFPSLIANVYMILTITFIFGIYWFCIKKFKNITTAFFYGSFLIFYIAAFKLMILTVLNVNLWFHPNNAFAPWGIGTMYSLWILPFIFFISKYKNKVRLFYGLFFYLQYVLASVLIFASVLIYFLYPQYYTEIRNTKVYFFNLFHYFAHLIFALYLMHSIGNEKWIKSLRNFISTSKIISYAFTAIIIFFLAIWLIRDRQLVFSRMAFSELQDYAINKNITEVSEKYNLKFLKEGSLNFGTYVYDQYYACPTPIWWVRCEAIRVLTDESGEIKYLIGRGPFVGNNFQLLLDDYYWYQNIIRGHFPNLDTRYPKI